eukprot:2744899-Lingulodinium_polyedra.AAC.2
MPWKTLPVRRLPSSMQCWLHDELLRALRLDASWQGNPANSTRQPFVSSTFLLTSLNTFASRKSRTS